MAHPNILFCTQEPKTTEKVQSKSLSNDRSVKNQQGRVENILRIEELSKAPDGFLEHDPEDAQFHRAFQAACTSEFQFGYFAIYRDEHRISIVPYFLMDFALNTMLPEGFLKKLFDRLAGGLKLKVACVGHPSSDFGRIHGEISAEVLELVNQQLFKKSKLVAYKGFSKDLPLKGYVQVPGLPVALLTIKGDYWSQLRSNPRHQIKKKLKQAQYLRIEECDFISSVQVQKIYELYLNTYQRAVVKLEKLNLPYFAETASISKYLLFYEGENMIGFCQLFRKKPRVTFRYIGLDYERSQKYGVYFFTLYKSNRILFA
jgi:hypothetical protein